MKDLSRIAKEGRINEDASLTDRQSIIINAPIEKVWNCLVGTETWPSWNDQIQWVKVSDDDPYTFTWHQNGRTLTASFQYMKAPYGLSWTAQTRLVKAIYLWNLDPTDENQTVATVSQSYQGVLLFMFMNHRKMHSDLLRWLDRLKQVAEPASTFV